MPGFVDASERVGIGLPEGSSEGIVHVPGKQAPLAVLRFFVEIVILKHVVECADVVDRANVAERAVDIKVVGEPRAECLPPLASGLMEPFDHGLGVLDVGVFRSSFLTPDIPSLSEVFQGLLLFLSLLFKETK